MLLDDSSIFFGEADIHVCKLLHSVFENPKLLAIAAKNDSEASQLKKLDYSLCNHFYRDVTSDVKLEKDLFRFITELLKVTILVAFI